MVSSVYSYFRNSYKPKFFSESSAWYIKVCRPGDEYPPRIQEINAQRGPHNDGLTLQDGGSKGASDAVPSLVLGILYLRAKDGLGRLR